MCFLRKYKAGQLSQKPFAWENTNQANQTVLDWIKFGVDIPFIQEPEQFFFSE